MLRGRMSMKFQMTVVIFTSARRAHASGIAHRMTSASHGVAVDEAPSNDAIN